MTMFLWEIPSLFYLYLLVSIVTCVLNVLVFIVICFVSWSVDRNKNLSIYYRLAQLTAVSYHPHDALRGTFPMAAPYGVPHSVSDFHVLWRVHIGMEYTQDKGASTLGARHSRERSVICPLPLVFHSQEMHPKCL